MKKFKILILTLLFTAFIPAYSFAFIDAGVYGGYKFSNTDTFTSTYNSVSDVAQMAEINNWKFGAIVHFNFKLPHIISAGVGPYFEMDMADALKLQETGFTSNMLMDFGASAYLQLDLIPVVHPYVRVTASIWQGYVGDFTQSPEIQALLLDPNSFLNFNSFFASYQAGIGIAFQIAIVDIFVEYMVKIDFWEIADPSLMFQTSHTNHQINLGARLNV